MEDGGRDMLNPPAAHREQSSELTLSDLIRGNKLIASTFISATLFDRVGGRLRAT